MAVLNVILFCRKIRYYRIVSYRNNETTKKLFLLEEKECLNMSRKPHNYIQKNKL